MVRVRRIALGLTVTIAVAMSGVAVSSGQSGLPDVRGLYVGPATRVLFNCNDPDSKFSFPLDWRTYFYEQTGAAFRSVSVDEEGNSTGFSFSGTVTATGEISGTYFLTLAELIAESGTFTGQITPGTLTMNLAGRLTFAIPDFPPDLLCETVSLSGNKVNATITSDVRITSTATPDPVASGTRLTYTYQINNAGPDAAPGVTIASEILEGASFASSRVSQGTFTAPGVGSTGPVNVFLGTIPANESATVTLTVNVLAAAGQSLSNTAIVASLSNDSKPANNSVTTETSIKGGGVVKLVWDQPAPTPANPTPAPVNLRIEPGSFTVVTTSDRAMVISPSADAPCTLSRVNVYKSDAQPVLLIAENLWKSVPPDQLQTAMSAAPGGSFYVITNVWQCGEMTVESGGSNEAGLPAGPTLSRVKVGGKIKIIGSGFTDPAQVFFDGIAFVKQAVFSDSTHIVQKGLLSDGRSAFDVATPGKTVLISVRNSNGGISSIAFTGQ